MVIMIDDDDDTLEIYHLLIEKTGFSDHFRTFNSGLEAFRFLDDNSRHQKVFPKYILLDLNMPDLGGIDFINKYEARFKDQQKHAEIIILTNSVRETDNKKALSYDAVTRFISKPLPKDDLISLIKDSTNP